ncbi:MAG: Cysteine desulfurase family protein [Herbinix sp.]|jgi:cysteine desulfurase family protein|nr:Cysteine desulfurase family protein [Herbinix sp.]
MIYLDNAATSLYKPEAVAEAVFRALHSVGNSGRGAHDASLQSGRIMLQTRSLLSELFKVGDPSRVVFTSNATESLNIAILGLLQPGDHCITSAMEHNSVLRPLYLLESLGLELTILPISEKGCMDLAEIEKAIKPNTKAIVVTHASNVTGNVNDIDGIGELCKKNNLRLILDASQTAGILPIDMKKMNLAALCCSGHKGLMGPQGTGVLALGEGVMPVVQKTGGTGVDSFSHTMPTELPEALEAGTQNIHGLAGLLEACKYNKEYGQEKIYQKSMLLARTFIRGVKALPGVTLYGDYEAALRVPVVALNLRDIASGELSDELFTRFGIATRAGVHCAPLLHEDYHTAGQGMVRFSFSHFNSEQEVEKAITALRLLEEEYR